MPKIAPEKLLTRKVELFNLLNPGAERKRARILREILRTSQLKYALIYGRSCYFPTREKLKTAASEKGRFLQIICASGSPPPRRILICAPGEGLRDFFEEDRLDVADVRLELERLSPQTTEEGGLAEKFLLKIKVR